MKILTWIWEETYYKIPSRKCGYDNIYDLDGNSPCREAKRRRGRKKVVGRNGMD